VQQCIIHLLVRHHLRGPDQPGRTLIKRPDQIERSSDTPASLSEGLLEGWVARRTTRTYEPDERYGAGDSNSRGSAFGEIRRIGLSLMGGPVELARSSMIRVAQVTPGR
jgi:hypothetical protein